MGKIMRLVPQFYGLQMAQCTFGSPRGVWLECTMCDRSDRIEGADLNVSDKKAASVFRKGGWTGKGNRMLRAQCPGCSRAAREWRPALWIWEVGFQETALVGG